MVGPVSADGRELCVACGDPHRPFDWIEHMDLPWQQVDCEVIDKDADLIATFANAHDAYLVVQAVNFMYGWSPRDE